ncbi:hypothetical protein [Thiocapsa roseopersicina]|uniref:Methyltransferase domain-containing protein n=1 Tax=Thiocapsa roseopersicina TaxID=1058 RepID=A0A1H3AY74_THIRO|nr:hypothetical protein [Thiocapsa roseopersicina]SDX33759.1 hypothetical protein SAMN05421783_12168 [Thiocapsa roseopersicina]
MRDLQPGIRLFEVFREVARVLKSGGRFILTFSNRWFPPKVIRIWQELHEYERLALVLEYLRESGRFGQLETFSLRTARRHLCRTARRIRPGLCGLGYSALTRAAGLRPAVG